MTPSRLFFYLRLAVGIGLLLMLFSFVDAQRLGMTLAGVDLPLIALGLLGILFNFALKTYRWAYILWVQRPELTFMQLLRFNWISMFLGNFLPTSMASDIVRIYCVARHMADPRDAVSSIVTDRMIGVFSLGVATIIAFVALQQTNVVQLGALASGGGVSVLLVITGIPLALQSKRLTGAISRVLASFSKPSLARRLHDFYDHFVAYQHQNRILLGALMMSFLNLFIAVLEFYVVAKGFAVEVAFGYFLLFIPLAVFLSMLPLSIGGMGLLETAIVFFFSRVGVSIELCVSLALVHRLLLLLSTLPGGMIYIATGLSPRKQSA